MLKTKSEPTRAAVSKIRFKLIIKPAMISFIALLVSFFIDVSAVPFFGNVTFDFPGMGTANSSI